MPPASGRGDGAKGQRQPSLPQGHTLGPAPPEPSQLLLMPCEAAACQQHPFVVPQPVGTAINATLGYLQPHC